jgi:ribonuclease HI
MKKYWRIGKNSMPDYKCQKEVRQRAVEFVNELNDSGFTAKLLEHSFRDYCVKISIEKSGKLCGDVLVYYKPSNATYTLGAHELKNKEIKPELDAIWYGEKKEATTAPITSEILQAYVDGSFLDGKIGYGVVILHGAQIIQELSGRIEDSSDDFESMRQVGGELQAVQEAIAWASANNIHEMGILYDYQGIESWATGAWKANNRHTLKYQTDLQSSPLKITWHKVQAHSGNRWNERADQLARMGAAGKSTDETMLHQEENAQNAIDQLTDLSISFVTYLSENQIPAEFEKIYNNMHARILFPRSSGKNFLDIYNTPKKPIDPKWHGFADDSLRKQVQELWNRFRTGDDKLTITSSRENEIALTVDHYFSILKPYRSMNFDFVELAQLIQSLASETLGLQLNVDFLRYNFDEIEKMYFQLKEKAHG